MFNFKKNDDIYITGEDQKREAMAEMKARADAQAAEELQKSLEGFDDRELEMIYQAVSIVHNALLRGGCYYMRYFEEDFIKNMIDERKKAKEE